MSLEIAGIPPNYSQEGMIEMIQGTHDSKSAQAQLTATDPSTIIVKPTPPFYPWPWPMPMPPILAERSEGLPLPGGEIFEVLEAVYPRPDIRSSVASSTRILVELLNQDEEAARLIDDLAQEVTPRSEERVAPLLVYGGYLLLGGLIGYLSRP